MEYRVRTKEVAGYPLENFYLGSQEKFVNQPFLLYLGVLSSDHDAYESQIQWFGPWTILDNAYTLTFPLETLAGQPVYYNTTDQLSKITFYSHGPEIMCFNVLSCTEVPVYFKQCWWFFRYSFLRDSYSWSLPSFI